MSKESPTPAPGRLQALGTGFVHAFAAVRAALYAAIAAVLIGLGLSSGLAVAVSRWLTVSLEAAKGSNFSLVDTFSMFLGSHLITVHTRSHAAFLSIDVTLKAGLVILLLVPLVAVLVGTLLFTWRFRTRAALSPAIYAGLTGFFYAIALAAIALFTHGSPVEAFIAGLLLGVPFALPAAYVGRRKLRPTAPAPTVPPMPEPVAAPDATALELPGPPTPATSVPAPPAESRGLRSYVPAFAFGAKTLGLELAGLTLLSTLTFALDGSPRSVLLLPNLAVYAMALLHGVTVSVLSNLERVGNLSLSVVSGLHGVSEEFAAYSIYRFLLVLIPLAVLLAAGLALERRRRTDRLGTLTAFALGYGMVGAFLVWACGIRLAATGAAVALLSDSGIVNASIGSSWPLTLVAMIPAAGLIGWVGALLAGKRATSVTGQTDTVGESVTGVQRPLFARPAAIISAVLIVAVVAGAVLAVPRVLPALSGLLGSRVETFSVALPDLEQATAVAELESGGFAVAGYAASDPGQPMVVAIDAAGGKLWTEMIDLGSLPGAAVDPAGATDPTAPLPESYTNPPADAGDSPASGPAYRPASPTTGDVPETRLGFRWTARLLAALPGGDIALAGSRLGTPLPPADRYTVQSAGPAPASEDAYVARLDGQGRPLWVVVWRDATLSPSGPLGLAVQEDGSLRLLIRAGRLGRRKIAELQATPDGKLSLGTTRETNPIAGLGPDTPEFAALTEKSCVPLAAAGAPGGGTVVCGYMNASTETGSDGQMAFLALLDKSGRLKWLRSPNIADMPSLAAVQATRDGGYVAVGVRGTGTWAVKADGRGLIRQEKSWK